jgi:hypothetical protein
MGLTPESENGKGLRRRLGARIRGDRLPTFLWLIVDSEGYVWLGDYTLAQTPSPAYTVFSPAGEWLGKVQVPKGFWPYEIGSDYLIGQVTDDYDVQSVARYSLDRRR